MSHLFRLALLPQLQLITKQSPFQRELCPSAWLLRIRQPSCWCLRPWLPDLLRRGNELHFLHQSESVSRRGVQALLAGLARVLGLQTRNMPQVQFLLLTGKLYLLQPALQRALLRCLLEPKHVVLLPLHSEPLTPAHQRRMCACACLRKRNHHWQRNMRRRQYLIA